MGSIGSNLQEVKRRIQAAFVTAGMGADMTAGMGADMTAGVTADMAAGMSAGRGAHVVTQAVGPGAVNSVTLLAVSKTFDAEAVREALAAGQHAFGENYVQEALAKIDALASLRSQLEWHFIGPLQSNKTRSVAEAFDWVHSVDRLKIAQRLAEQRPPHLPPLQLCLQVNVSGEAS